VGEETERPVRMGCLRGYKGFGDKTGDQIGKKKKKMLKVWKNKKTKGGGRGSE